ncbi:hypothetical protein BHYA_0120g00300 [Botrytis hyacinthi]|uniref:BTB domain-containing protein n=1 Tax=Botrytis hyacinthi TaxID=278943 RepID=A0A4Z1GIS1_9HELO|nr:hypothetical protein BHYA_0120g00300 [Botrytis hyacinthi]
MSRFLNLENISRILEGHPFWITTMSIPSKPSLMTPEALNETVTLYVGSEEKKYIVHKKILCDQSEFFNAGLNNGFKEATDGEMYLPEDDPATFADLIEYLYRGALPYTDKITTRPMQELYCLAEKICMPLLMDKLIDAIMKAHAEKNYVGFDAARIQSIYENTHSASKLRLYASAALAFSIHFDFKNTVDSGMYIPLSKPCPEIFTDVLTIYVHRLSLMNFGGPLNGVKDAFGPYGFHVPSSDGACYKTVERSTKLDFNK